MRQQRHARSSVGEVRVGSQRHAHSSQGEVKVGPLSEARTQGRLKVRVSVRTLNRFKRTDAHRAHQPCSDLLSLLVDEDTTY